jgi:hypothetical protein
MNSRENRKSKGNTTEEEENPGKCIISGKVPKRVTSA